MSLGSDKFPLRELWDELDGIKVRLRTLEMPTGTSIGSLVQQVQAALANINATVSAAIAANSYTKTQIDSKIASPGTIAPVDVTATGKGTFPNGLSSTDIYNRLVTYGGPYRTVSAHQDGTLGYAPSSRRFKQDEKPAPVDLNAALAIQVVTFRYIQAVRELGDGAAVEWGVIAEDLDSLGFDWLVDYDDDGEPFGVKKEQIIFAFIPVIQDHERRLARLEVEAG